MEDDTEDTEHDEKENGTKNGNGHFAQSLVLSLVNKTLEDRKQRNEHGMSREEQVVYHHLGLSGNNKGDRNVLVIHLLVLSPNLRNVEH